MIFFTFAVTFSLLSAILLGTLTYYAAGQPRILNSSSLASSAIPPPSSCKIQEEGLPDPNCTPGAASPHVTQNNIHSTICVPGYTKAIEPPVSYTGPLKTKLMQSYGLSDSRTNYELDHLIPVEIGGDGSSVQNLWPEPFHIQYNAHVKDAFENYLHNQVCSGSMRLSDAQNQIATNWIAAQNTQNDIAANLIAAQHSIHSPVASMIHNNITLSRGSTDEDDNAP